MEPKYFAAPFFLLLPWSRAKNPEKGGKTGMRDYELVYIIRPTVDEEGVTNVVESVSGLVKAGDGEVTSVDVWGRRTLAYPINNHREGVYVLSRVKMPPSALTELERNLKLSEEIIRYLLVRVDS